MKMSETFQKKYKKLYLEMATLCENEPGVGDPFSYARSKEIFTAIEMQHEISDTLAGADGIDQEGACEYKSTTGKSIQGAYTGISVQPTWADQEKYLREEKIGKYENHYYSRFEGSKGIVEIWKLSGDDVLSILLPKLRKKYDTVLTMKDPRLQANVSKKDIKQYGIQIR
jgi:hypothetical protein|tara:strand:- start:206 stop:715 length:510 start_codon:yes stop_codon:yes gene_type:complete